MPTEAELRLIISAFDKTGGAVNSARKKFQALGSSLRRVGSRMTAGVTVPLVGLGTVAVKTASDFESQLRIMEIAARSSGASIEELRSYALRMGADTFFSSSEAAEAMTGLFKAGMSADEVMGDLTGTTGALASAMDLASASNLNLAGASDIVSIAMASFGLNAAEASAIANSFVQAADASVAEVGELAQALANVGPTAAAFGWSLESLNTALAVLSERGIRGSEAGTALRSMMTNLMRDTDDVTETLADLNVKLYDASGTMKSLPTIIGELSRGMAGLTEEQRNQAIQTLAGTYGMKAMQTLLAEGVSGWREMETEISGAATAQEIAATKMDTFAGSMEALQGSIETLLIQAGTPLINEFLRPLVERLSEAVGAILEANPAFLKWGVVIAGIAAAAGPVLILLGLLSTAIGALLSPIGLVVAAVAALAAAWATNFGSIRDKVSNAWSAISGHLEQAREWLEMNLPGAIETLRTRWSEFWSGAKARVSDAWSAISGHLEQAREWLGTNIPAAVEILRARWSEFWSGAKARVSDAWSAISGHLEQAREWLEVNLPGAIEILRGKLTGLREGVGTFGAKFSEVMGQAREIWARLVDFFEPTLERLKESWGKMIESFEPVGAKLQELWAEAGPVLEALGQIVGTILVLAFNLLMEIVAGVMPYIGDIVSAVVDLMIGAFKLLQGVIGGLIDFVKAILAGDWAAAWEAAKRIVVSIKEAMVTAITSLWTIIRSIVMGLVKGVTGFFKNLYQKLVGGSIFPEMVKKIIAWFEKLPKELLKIATKICDRVVEKFEALKKAVVEKVKELKEKVIEKVEEIKKFISGFSLFEAGRALIQGLIDGVRDMAERLLSAATGVVRDAIEGARRLLGIGSPSRVFKEMGANVVLGFVEGLDAEKLEAQKAVAETFRDIVGAVADIGEALAGLSGLSLDFQAGLFLALEDQIGRVLVVLIRLARDYGPGWREAAREFAEQTKGVFGTLGDAVSNLAAIHELPLSFRPGIFLALEDQIGRVLVVLNRLARDFGPGWRGAAREFAEQTEGVFGTLGDAVSNLTAIQGLSLTCPPGVYQALERHIGKVLVIFNRLAHKYGPSWREAAVNFATTIQPIFGVVKAASDAFKLLTEEVGELNRSTLVKLAQGITEIVAFFDAALPPIELGADAADSMVVKFQRWSDRLGPLLSLVRSTASILKIVSEEISTEIAINVERMVETMQFVLSIFDRLLPSIDLVEGTADAMAVKFQRWDERVRPLVSLVRSTAGILKIVSEEISTEIAINVQRMVETMQFVLSIFDRLLPSIDLVEGTADAMAVKFQRWDERVRPLVSLVRSTASILKIVSEEISTEIAANVQRMVEVIQQVADEFNRALTPIAIAEGATDAMADKFQAWVARLQPLTTVAKSMVELLEILAAEISTDLDVAAIRNIVTLTETIASEFNRWFSAITLAEGATDSLAEKFQLWAARVKPLIALAKGVADLLDALATDFSTAVDSAKIEALAQATQQIINEFDRWLPAITVAEGQTDSIREKFQNWAARLTPLKALVQSTITVLKGLSENVSTAVDEAKLGEIISAMLTIVGRFNEWLPQIELADNATDLIIEKLQGWSARLAVVKELVDAVLGIISAVAGFEGLPRWRVEAFKDATVAIGEALIGGLVEGMGGKMKDWTAALDSVLESVARLAPVGDQERTGEALVQGLISGVQRMLSEWRAALDTLIEALRDKLDPAREMDHRGAIYGSALVQGLIRGVEGMGRQWAQALQRILDTIYQLLHPQRVMRLIGGLLGNYFVQGIIDGINGRLPDLEATLAYLAGLFPSSPAERGPFRKLPNWEALATGLGQALGGINAQLRGFRPTLAVAPVAGVAGPAVAYQGGGREVHVHFHVGAFMGTEYDAQQFARKLSPYVRREGLR